MADKTDLTEITFGTYYVRDGAEAEFERVLLENWSTLRRLGFVADETPQLYRSVSGATHYLELTKWVPGVMGPAHEHPDVIPIWTRLVALLQPHTPAVVEGLAFDEFVPVRLHAGA